MCCLMTRYAFLWMWPSLLSWKITANPRYGPVRSLFGGFVRTATLAYDSEASDTLVVLKETWKNSSHDPLESFGPAGPAFAASSRYKRSHTHHHNMAELGVVLRLQEQQPGLAAADAGLLLPIAIEELGLL